MSTLFKFIILCFLFGKFVFADEIIQDKNGNYFLMKDDGTFIKLPKPKAGNKGKKKRKHKGNFFWPLWVLQLAKKVSQNDLEPK